MIHKERMDQLRAGVEWPLLERLLGYKFRHRRFLERACTHPSATPGWIEESYEFLEALSDRVINLLVADALSQAPGRPRHIDGLISNQHLAKAGTPLRLQEFLLYGAGLPPQEELPGILADMFEALAGAVWTDSGRDYSRVEGIFLPLIFAQPTQGPAKYDPLDVIAQLDHAAVEKFGERPEYVGLRGAGGHYMVEVRLNWILLGTGEGNKLLGAYATAAKNVLRRTGNLTRNLPEGLRSG